MKQKLQNLKTKIFLDSGDPEETKQAMQMLGGLDGQTTNPSLVSKNPEIAARFENGKKLSEEELLNEYKKIIKEISSLIPNKSVSIEVYANKETTSDEMIEQAIKMNKWIDTAHIKLPVTKGGLDAENQLLKMGMKTNMTLVFNQEQAAAVHAAAEKIEKGDVFVSPFVGRLDDKCRDGMDLINNIQKMYKEQNSNVEVLVASVRDLNHLLYSLYSEVDIITIPFKIIKEWFDEGLPIPGVDVDLREFKNQNEFFAETRDECIIDIEYKKVDLSRNWNDYNIEHELTNVGIEKFVKDWEKLIE